MSHIKAPPPSLRRILGGASGYVSVEVPWSVPYATKYRCSDGKLRELDATQNIDVDVTCTYSGTRGGGVTSAVALHTYYYVYLVPDAADDDKLVAVGDTQYPGDGPQATDYDTAWYYCGTFFTNGFSDPTEFSQVGGMFFFEGDDWNQFQHYAPADPGWALDEWVVIANLHEQGNGAHIACPLTAGLVYIKTVGQIDYSWNWAGKTYPIAPTAALDTPTRTMGTYADDSPHQWMHNPCIGKNLIMQRTSEHIVYPGNPILYGWFWKQGSAYMEFNCYGWRDAYVGMQ